MVSERVATWIARLGFAARGLVYILIGWFAIDAAQGGPAPKDQQAAMGTLLDQPLGHVLLAAVVVGLAGYAFWRLTEALLDPERRGSDRKGLAERLAYGLSGLTHVFLAIYAAKAVLHLSSASGSSPGDASARSWSGWLMAHPGGQWLVGLVGVGFLVVALAQAAKAWKGKFIRNLERDAPAPRYLCTVGRIGYAARALVFALVGWFFINAALDAEPGEVGGIGLALRTLREQPYGAALLATVAAGLMLFGSYSLIEARFRRIHVSVPGR